MCVGEVEVQLQAFSISVLDGGEWANSRPCPFIPGREFIIFLNRRLDVPQGLAGHSGEVKITTDL
jgi:hypothetical protein